MQFTINLQPGQWHRQDTPGRLFVLIDTGAVSAVELRLMRGNQELESIRTAMRGTKARTPEGFTHIELRASAPTACELVISDGAVDFDVVNGATVKVTADTPLQVSNDRGSPGNLLHVVGVSVADAPATAITNAAAVACGPAAVVVAAANANRRGLRFLNLGPDPVAIGAAGITWAARCVVLEVGDMWVEDRAANLAWSAITDAGKAASVTAQGVTA